MMKASVRWGINKQLEEENARLRLEVERLNQIIDQKSALIKLMTEHISLTADIKEK